MLAKLAPEADLLASDVVTNPDVRPFGPYSDTLEDAEVMSRIFSKYQQLDDVGKVLMQDMVEVMHTKGADQESLLKSADNCLHSRLCALEKQQEKQRWITSSHAPEMR